MFSKKLILSSMIISIAIYPMEQAVKKSDCLLKSKKPAQAPLPAQSLTMPISAVVRPTTSLITTKPVSIAQFQGLSILDLRDS